MRRTAIPQWPWMVVIVAVAGASLWFVNRERKQEAKNHIVRTVEEVKDRDLAQPTIAVPENPAEAELQQMIEGLFDPQRHDLCEEELRWIGDTPTPHLIAALKEQRTLKAGSSKDWMKNPAYTILQLLRSDAPAEAAKAVAPYVSGGHTFIREEAARILARIATAECAAPVSQALADPEHLVWSKAINGVRNSIAEGAAQQEFLTAIFPAVAKRVYATEDSWNESPQLLLEIDSRRARDVLLSKENFRLENADLDDIFKAFNESDRQIPREQLHTMIEQFEKRPSDDPSVGAYGEALKSLARAPDGSTEEYLTSKLDHPSDTVQSGAAEALGVLVGVKDAVAVVYTGDVKTLTPPQKTYLAVFDYDGQVNNGGHSQYFYNSYGDDWPDAVAGLKEMGAAQRAKMLQDATAVFGRSGPSRVRDDRIAQLDRLTEDGNARLNALDQQYYDSKENLAKLLALYAVNHRDHFQPREGAGE